MAIVYIAVEWSTDLIIVTNLIDGSEKTAQLKAGSLSYQQLCPTVRLTIDVGTVLIRQYCRQLIVRLSKPRVKVSERLEVRCFIFNEV